MPVIVRDVTIDNPIFTSVDIVGPLYQLPVVETDHMYDKITRVTAADVSSGVVGGTGVFDLLMAASRAHLDREYENGRITGAEYTKAYIDTSAAAMQMSLQFVLGREQAFWTAQNAQIQAVTGRIALESARFTYQNIQPAQLQLLNEQGDVQRAQTSNTRLDGVTVAGVMGAQKALYTQQIISYQRDSEIKAAKIFTDAWITQKTMDEGLTPPAGFTNVSIDTILTALKLNNGF